MELTGKCKEEFRGYLLNGILDASYTYRYFITLPKSMQYGVYVDFFDSVGINSSSFSHYEFYKCNLDNTLFHTRPEARVLAIEKANEIYNNAH
jgi:hypothetical protein